MNFVKNGTLKLWILCKMRLWKCEFCEFLNFAPVWNFRKIRIVSFYISVYTTNTWSRDTYLRIECMESPVVCCERIALVGRGSARQHQSARLGIYEATASRNGRYFYTKEDGEKSTFLNSVWKSLKNSHFDTLGQKPTFYSEIPLILIVFKIWILWRLRFQKCEFCENWDFKIVNFVKKEIAERWIL